MKSKTIITTASKISFVVISFIGSACFTQDIHPLEPVTKYYKTLAELSAAPDARRAEMDKIVFPWENYSTKSLLATRRPVYLGSEDSAKLHKLVRYPANSSDQTRAELDYLLKVQETRTPEQIKRSEVIANASSEAQDWGKGRKGFFIATPVGDWFTTENFPATAQLLTNCGEDIRLTEFFLKRDFKRSRPYHMEQKLKPLTQIGTPAFPSGHTLWAYADAYVLGEIIPEKREEFLKLADEVRWSREIMGIHFPSDNEAARVIGWHLLKSWYHNPKFVADMEKAKAEWKEKKSKFSK